MDFYWSILLSQRLQIQKILTAAGAFVAQLL